MGITFAGAICFVLASAENAEASKPLPFFSLQEDFVQPAVCVACASPTNGTANQFPENLQSPLLDFDPCDACHYPIRNSQPLSANDKVQLLHAVEQLQSRVLTFSQRANAFQKQDARYQQAVSSFWKVEAREGTGSIQAAYTLIQQANDWLADLENEARSGFWQQSRPTQPIKAILAVNGLPKLKSVSLPCDSLFILIPSRQSQALDNPGLVNPLMPVMQAKHRRGPPMMVFYMDSEIMRRLPLGQSPFCFRMMAHMRGNLSLNAAFSQMGCSHSFVKEPTVVVQSVYNRIGGYALSVIRNLV